MRKKVLASAVFAAIVVTAALTGCRSLFSPSNPSKGGWENAVKVNVTQTIPPESGGTGTVTLDGMIPGPNSRLLPETEPEIWVTVFNDNNRNQRLLVGVTVVDDPSEKPGWPGREVAFLNPGGFDGFKPGEKRQVIFGYGTVSVPQDVPYLRLIGYYFPADAPGTDWGLYAGKPPSWTLDFRLGWRK